MTSTFYGFAGLGTFVILAFFGRPDVGFIASLVVAVSWQCHVLEVKVNKLLDDRQISVSKEEINQ